MMDDILTQHQELEKHHDKFKNLKKRFNPAYKLKAPVFHKVPTIREIVTERTPAQKIFVGTAHI